MNVVIHRDPENGVVSCWGEENTEPSYKAQVEPDVAPSYVEVDWKEDLVAERLHASLLVAQDEILGNVGPTPDYSLDDGPLKAQISALRETRALSYRAFKLYQQSGTAAALDTLRDEYRQAAECPYRERWERRNELRRTADFVRDPNRPRWDVLSQAIKALEERLASMDSVQTIFPHESPVYRNSRQVEAESRELRYDSLDGFATWQGVMTNDALSSLDTGDERKGTPGDKLASSVLGYTDAPNEDERALDAAPAAAGAASLRSRLRLHKVATFIRENGGLAAVEDAFLAGCLPLGDEVLDHITAIWHFEENYHLEESIVACNASAVDAEDDPERAARLLAKAEKLQRRLLAQRRPGRVKTRLVGTPNRSHSVLRYIDYRLRHADTLRGDRGVQALPCLAPAEATPSTEQPEDIRPFAARPAVHRHSVLNRELRECVRRELTNISVRPTNIHVELFFAFLARS